jgi:hypothetical protein
VLNFEFLSAECGAHGHADRGGAWSAPAAAALGIDRASACSNSDQLYLLSWRFIDLER